MFPKTPSLTGLGISVKYVFKYIHVMLNFLRNERHYVKTAGLIAKRSQFFLTKPSWIPTVVYLEDRGPLCSHMWPVTPCVHTSMYEQILTFVAQA